MNLQHDKPARRAQSKHIGLSIEHVEAGCKPGTLVHLSLESLRAADQRK